MKKGTWNQNAVKGSLWKEPPITLQKYRFEPVYHKKLGKVNTNAGFPPSSFKGAFVY